MTRTEYLETTNATCSLVDIELISSISVSGIGQQLALVVSKYSAPHASAVRVLHYSNYLSQGDNRLSIKLRDLLIKLSDSIYIKHVMTIHCSSFANTFSLFHLKPKECHWLNIHKNTTKSGPIIPWLSCKISEDVHSNRFLFSGFNKFDGVDFEGTFFIDTQVDDDYVGFVFR